VRTSGTARNASREEVGSDELDRSLAQLTWASPSANQSRIAASFLIMSLGMLAHSTAIPPLPKCELGHEIPAHVTLCIVCGAHVGFPNVRYAARKEETEALDKRLADARISATAKGSLDRLEAFGKAVDGSKAVVSRFRADLDAMLSGGGKLMQAYYPAVRAGLRVPQNNEFDPARDPNDARVSPVFYDSLHFAALSLDRLGVPHYGNFAITLREEMIAKRTTVFEENPVKFNERFPASRSRPFPYGYRASWQDRSTLAMAKLQHKIEASTADAEFADILLEKQSDPNAFSDFIEVHVYGPIHPGAFEHVIAEIPDDDLEKLFWDRMKPKLESFGVSFEEVGA